jgi:hypothetical protein
MFNGLFFSVDDHHANIISVNGWLIGYEFGREVKAELG